jgi:hypothetical protein
VREGERGGPAGGCLDQAGLGWRHVVVGLKNGKERGGEG